MELQINDFAFGGNGVGKIVGIDGADGANLAAIKEEFGGLVVFVERVIPGDKVEVSLTRIKKSFCEARLEKIITPSKLRIEARCKHFGLCGGCSLQCMEYGEQLKWKEKIVRDSLERIGEISAPPIAPIIGSESPWFYRNKMEYSFGEEFRRPGEAKLSAAESLKLGLHPAKSFRDVFNLEECFLESELSAQIAVEVRQWAILRKIQPYDPRTNAGVLRNLMVREGKNTNEIMVILFTNGEDFPNEKDFAKLIAEKFPAVTSVYRTAVVIKKGHKTTTKEFHLAGKKTLTETLTVKKSDGKNVTLKFEILPQAFFQPNTKGAQLLYETALNFADPQGTETIYDLFCGTGTIGMFAASRAEKVIGIELNASAVENARKNAEQNDIKNIAFLCGDVDKMLPELKGKADIIITDPPRCGIFPKTLQKILELRPAKWVYVSCNPTTLARDLKEAIAAGYTLKKVQPVDMFPHTYHVETVCELSIV